MKLDSYQQKAAFQNYPYSIIIAGAGTGKTHTLLGRISYLVQELGIRPNEILVISYTNETVKDFQKKVQEQLGFPITVFTFHKLALYLLELARQNFSICSNDALSYVVEEVVKGIVPWVNSLQKQFLRVLFPFYSFYLKDFNRVQNSKELKDIKKQIVQFIHLWYAKGYSKEQLSNLISTNFGKKKAFYILVYVVIYIYETELESQNLLDFDSMIFTAMEVISDIHKFPFRHVLVDEFQDSSQVRMDFLIKMVQRFDLHFTVVGDDCQSIYRFSGTATNCFLLLQQAFPNIHTFYLKYTYRNSQELIVMANHFVLKNRFQLKKDILSTVHIDFPIEILFYRKKNSIFKMLEYIHPSSQQSVLFLGRNSFDWKYYFCEDEIQWKDKKHFSLHRFPEINFMFLTVHQSKGLEADVVIILHMECGVYGFPNKIENPSYFSCVEEKNVIAYEEERRLFYVALTRTKGKVFLVTPIGNPSLFVEELRKDFKKQLKILFF